MKRFVKRTVTPSFAVAVLALAVAVGSGTALGQSLASPRLASPGAYHNINGFRNGWTFFPKADGYGRARYYKDAVGIVHLEGVIYGGGGDNNAFVLPKGDRPLVTHAYVVAATVGDGFVDVDVYSNGDVYVNGVGDPCSLDGISFRTR
jgi:hypothetical protein